MNAALLFFGLVWALLGGRSSSPAPGPSPTPAPGPSPTPPPPPPWPVVLPAGLPPFPGKGWEYDEPPPVAVQQRAGQLVQQLWGNGSGTFRVEQTAGRWVAYRAELVSSGKKGVVAYRVKRAALPPAAPERRPAARTAPAAPAAPRGAPPYVPAPSPAYTPYAVPSSVELPTLKYGAGLKPKAPVPEVFVLQNKLNVKPADGRFGHDLDKAVRTFQAVMVKHDRPGWSSKDVDGVVGPKTWTALFAVRA